MSQIAIFHSFMAELYSTAHVNSLIHSSMDGHLGCFHILAIVNNAAMNKEVHISFQISVFVFFRKILRSGIARSKTLAPWKKSYAKPRQNIKKQRHYFAYKGAYSQSYGFSSSHVWMRELDYKDS